MDAKVFAVIFMLFSCFDVEAGNLSYNFYSESCPELENIVRAGVESFTLADPTTPSALLRLMFHDCQVQCCDASILLDPDGFNTTTSEMDSMKNFGVRKRDTISLIKSTVEAMCPQQVVSCADILVLATREGVALSGGPRIEVPLGRRDSFSSPNFTLADASLPPADIGIDSMLQLFAKKGMTVEESVAILGAHTLGVTHCINLQDRLHSQKNRPGNAMNPLLENALKIRCPVEDYSSSASKIGFLENDLTAVLFDNQYFVNLMSGGGLLKIDAEMPLDSRTRPFVEKFAADQDKFFQAFSSAFVKLSSFDVLTGNQGVIRRNCNGLM